MTTDRDGQAREEIEERLRKEFYHGGLVDIVLDLLDDQREEAMQRWREARLSAFEEQLDEEQEKACEEWEDARYDELMEIEDACFEENLKDMIEEELQKMKETV
jgi:hypothetical protein